MNISDAQFAIAASQLRATAMMLDSKMSELRDTGRWQGPDAEKFFQEWESDVRGRLFGAAVKLDALAFVPFL